MTGAGSAEGNLRIDRAAAFAFAKPFTFLNVNDMQEQRGYLRILYTTEGKN